MLEANLTADVEAALDRAAAVLAGVDAAGLITVRDDELCGIIRAAEAVARKLGSIQALAAAEIADRSRHELGPEGLSQRYGATKPGPFIEQLTRISGAEASRRIHLGAALRTTTSISAGVLPARFPAVARAVVAGEIGAEAASIIVRALDAVRRVAALDDLDVAEAGLVEHARRNPVQFVVDLAIVVRDRLDPDGVLPRDEETRLRRGIVLGRERNGIVPISGGLAPTTAALLKSTFDEANAPGAQPRFLSDDDRQRGTVTTVNEDGAESISLIDKRSRVQRQHDVLDGLLKAGIRNSGFEPGQVRSIAEVTAHISIADLEAGTGVGWIDGITESVSVNTIQRILCDARFRRAILGNDGETIAFGKTRYPFSPTQKRAIVARDGDKCIMPGCDVPATWSDAHHVEEYFTHGASGTTDVRNGVMICEPHHDLVHHSDWRLKMINGIPYLLAPPEIDPSKTWQKLGKQRVQLRKLA